MKQHIHNEDHKNDNLEKLVKVVHEGQKCDSCGKSFSTAQYLKKHIHTVHEGHKDYNCDSCRKSFHHAQQLKRHIHKCPSSGK